MHRQLPHLLLLALLAAPASAQTIQGTVVSHGAHEVRRGVHVALLDDSLHKVRETDTDSTLGAFYLDAPRGGRYSLAVYDRLGNPYASAPFQIDSGGFFERELALPVFPPELDSLPVVAYLRAGPPAGQMTLVRYPEAMRDAGRSGHVRVAFIVNADGDIERGSLHVIEATDDAFARSVAAARNFVRFPPASADGRPPRVVSQLTFGFNIEGAPKERGDIMIASMKSIIVIHR